MSLDIFMSIDYALADHFVQPEFSSRSPRLLRSFWQVKPPFCLFFECIFPRNFGPGRVHQASADLRTNFVEVYRILNSYPPTHLALTKIGTAPTHLLAKHKIQAMHLKLQRGQACFHHRPASPFCATGILSVFSHPHEATCTLPERAGIMGTTTSCSFNGNSCSTLPDTLPTIILSHSTMI